MKRSVFQALCAAALLSLGVTAAQVGPNPTFPYYGYGSIVASPNYPIVGETAQISVTVNNNGDEPATDVTVRLSFNDWGVTFFGWQTIGEMTIPVVNPGVPETVVFSHVFETRAHTCLEVLILDRPVTENLNDDRGQINLEVVNAGETFEWWVPVVNEGDHDMDLLVMARCDRPDDPTGQADCPLDDRPEVVHLEPGEEALVPIRLDLRGADQGEELAIIVEAFDMNAGNPFVPDNRNHVRLVVRRQDARDLKQAAHDGLVALVASAAADTRGRLNSAAGQIERALNLGNWNGANRLKRGGGPAVFAAELAAVNTLLGLLETDLPVATKEQINQAVLNLVDADRILAQTAAAGNPAARALVGTGDDQRQAGDYPGAINTYKHAWQTATR